MLSVPLLTLESELVVLHYGQVVGARFVQKVSLGRVPSLQALIAYPIRMTINTIHVDANLKEEEIDYSHLPEYILFIALFIQVLADLPDELRIL